jgi:protein O-GlcNAc transferase
VKENNAKAVRGVLWSADVFRRGGRLSVFRILADRIWALIAQLSGLRKGPRAKFGPEWGLLITGLILSLWGVVEQAIGDGMLTRNDLTREQIATRRDAALSDNTGKVAEAALDALIAQRKAARERLARDEAALYRQKGALAFLHDTDKAMQAYAKATELDPENATSWNRLGVVQWRTGALDAASRSYQQALELANRQKDYRTIATAMGNLGTIHYARRNLDRARELHENSLRIWVSLGDKSSMAANYCNLGIIYAADGDHRRADAACKMALALNQALNNEKGMARDYHNLGSFYLMRGDLDHAEAMHYRSLALEEKLGRKEDMAADYANLAIIHRRRGDYHQADATHRTSLALFLAIGRKDGIASTTANQGILHARKGDKAQACAHWLKARDLFVEIGMPHEVSLVQGNLRVANCPAKTNDPNR